MVARNAKIAAVPVRTSARISTRLKATKPAGISPVLAKAKSNGVSKSKAPVKVVGNLAKAAAATKSTTKAKTTSKAKSQKLVVEEEEVGTAVTTATTTIVQVAEPDGSEETVVTTTLTTDVHPGITHILKVNPKLATVISRHECTIFSPEGLREPVEPFQALCSGIIAQQVSGAAAKSIKTKFIALFNDESKFPAPAEILTVDLPTLRTAGLSQRKAEYISGLAKMFDDGELTNEMLMNSSDEVVTENLIKVRGLGLWSVQMFMMFALKRTDVFATGDLGIQKGMAVMAGKDVNKLKYAKEKSKWKYMSEEDMLKQSEAFKPYRSILSWYLWRLADTDVEVMKEKESAKKKKKKE
ncbi:hypothetical protein H072_10844 [Dactylellina haptotyla CBS 200.50]|uniref:HhH-GPD domain-containing protein n=1 Tax=Dactylellina haptotyla (strain CBS 200.50) TaxID=1284197 RepID=S8BKB5_DACHA|nr:hypothetical protein H072_10844 [Dactylellina haptotyla CBS 200.50]